MCAQSINSYENVNAGHSQVDNVSLHHDQRSQRIDILFSFLFMNLSMDVFINVHFTDNVHTIF